MNELWKNIKETRLLSGVFLCHILLGLAPVTFGTMHLHTRSGPRIHTLNNHFKTNKTSLIRELFFTCHKIMTFLHSSEKYLCRCVYTETSLRLETAFLKCFLFLSLGIVNRQ